MEEEFPLRGESFHFHLPFRLFYGFCEHEKKYARSQSQDPRPRVSKKKAPREKFGSLGKTKGRREKNRISVVSVGSLVDGNRNWGLECSKLNAQVSTYSQRCMKQKMKRETEQCE